MTNQHESFPDLMQDDSFEVVMRGYSRRQVHDYMTRSRNQIRDLEERLARAVDQAEQGRIELAEARRRMVEAPQNYEDLSPRLAQILQLGEEEAAAKRHDAENDAAKLREEAPAESERLATTARDQADSHLAQAQAEAEHRVAEATAVAERLRAQAQSESEQTVAAARAEADETLHSARAEAERLLSSAQQESEQMVGGARAEAEATLGSARAQAEATLAAAQSQSEQMLAAAEHRVAALDEQTGRRVSYLTDTHGEVMRRLHEIGSVLGDLLHQESAAGPLVNESQVLPPVAAPEPQDAAPELTQQVRRLIEPTTDEQHEVEVEAVRVIVEDETAHPDHPGHPGPAGATDVYDQEHDKVGDEPRDQADGQENGEVREEVRDGERDAVPPAEARPGDDPADVAGDRDRQHQDPEPDLFTEAPRDPR